MRFTKARYRVEIHTDKNGEWCWRIVSVFNGQVLCHSETYSSYNKAHESARLVAKDAGWKVDDAHPHAQRLGCL